MKPTKLVTMLYGTNRIIFIVDKQAYAKHQPAWKALMAVLEDRLQNSTANSEQLRHIAKINEQKEPTADFTRYMVEAVKLLDWAQHTDFTETLHIVYPDAEIHDNCHNHE